MKNSKVISPLERRVELSVTTIPAHIVGCAGPAPAGGLRTRDDHLNFLVIQLKRLPVTGEFTNRLNVNSVTRVYGAFLPAGTH